MRSLAACLEALKCLINSINSCAPRGLWDCSWLQFIEKLMEHDGTWWNMMEHVLPAPPRQAPLRACTWPWILWQVQHISSSTSTCFGPVQAILLQEINQPLLMPRSQPKLIHSGCIKSSQSVSLSCRLGLLCNHKRETNHRPQAKGLTLVYHPAQSNADQ